MTRLHPSTLQPLVTIRVYRDITIFSSWMFHLSRGGWTWLPSDDVIVFAHSNNSFVLSLFNFFVVITGLTLDWQLSESLRGSLPSTSSPSSSFRRGCQFIQHKLCRPPVADRWWPDAGSYRTTLAWSNSQRSNSHSISSFFFFSSSCGSG